MEKDIVSFPNSFKRSRERSEINSSEIAYASSSAFSLLSFPLRTFETS